MKTLLVPVDLSDAMEPTVLAALTLARGCGAEIVLLHAISPPFDYAAFPLPPDAGWEMETEAVRKKLTPLLLRLRGEGVPVRFKLYGGDAIQAILTEARETEADTIVMGSHGHTALYDFLIGSTTSGVAKAAPCPVIVVPARKPIVAGTLPAAVA